MKQQKRKARKRAYYCEAQTPKKVKSEETSSEEPKPACLLQNPIAQQVAPNISPVVASSEEHMKMKEEHMKRKEEYYQRQECIFEMMAASLSDLNAMLKSALKGTDQSNTGQ